MHIHDGHHGVSISRRSFLRTGTLTTAAVPGFSARPVAASNTDTATERALFVLHSTNVGTNSKGEIN